MMKNLLNVGLLLAVAPIAWSQTAALDPTSILEAPPPKTVDRSHYNLFNPTPSDQMRDFAPDRPNVTDGPYTVDPGHFLLEVGLFEYSRDRYNSDRVRLDSFGFGDINIRFGVTNYVEVDALFTVYSYVQTKDQDTGAQLKQAGFSDLTLRSKINLFGNDDGPFAIGLIPFVTFPTGQDGFSNRGFAGGIGVPVQFALPVGFQLGIETTIQTVHEPGGGSHFDYLNSISLGHAITKKISTYIELATDVTTSASADWTGTIDTALIYQPISNWQFDAGVNIGVTRATNELFTFIGAAWRY